MDSSQAIQARARGETPRWWQWDEPDERARAMMDVATSLEVWSYNRRYVNLAYARMFSGRDLPTIYGLSMSRSAVGLGGAAALEFLNVRTPAFNLIGSCIETLVNRLGRNRIWVKYLTDGGDFETRTACEEAEDYVEGLMYGAKFPREQKQLLQDELIWGTTFGYAHDQDLDNPGVITFERVIPDEILVDDLEALYGKPRNIYRRKFVSKQQLANFYLERGAPGDQGKNRRAEIEAAIWGAASAFPGLMGLSTANYSDMIPYVEGWHLGPGGKGGIHLLTVGNKSLTPKEEQGYERARFPFAVGRYNNLGFGFWGQGLCEILAPYQKKLNKLEAVIDEAQTRLGQPRVVNDAATGITAQMWANKVAGFVTKKPGTPDPNVLTPPVVSPELYQERQTWITLGYKRSGISEDMAAGQASEGVRSGAAEDIREDIKSQRFICTGQGLEDLGCDAADLMLDIAIERKPQIDRPGRDPIKWTDVKSAIETAIAKPFPISLFSTYPGARLREADRALAAGQVTKTDYMRIIDYPDVKGISRDLATSAANNIDRTISLMLKGGAYNPPDQYMDVQLAFSTAHARFEYERSHGTDEDTLEPLSTFIDQCDRYIKAGQAGPTQPQAQSIVATGPQGLEAQTTGAPAAAPPTGLASAGVAATQPTAGAMQ